MYGDSHRYFVQYMLKNGSVSKNKALEFLSKLNLEVDDLSSLKGFLSIINGEIVAHGFRLCCTTCEVSGEDLIIWLNTRYDHLNKLQNTFSAIELEYFQILMREIIISKERCLLYSVCGSLPTTLTSPLSKTDAFNLLTKWIKSGYFVIKNSRVYLGARCILEFSSYFREHCSDYLNTCGLCSEILFKGETCDNCEYMFHALCVRKFLSKRKLCPKCKSVWKEVSDEDASTSA